MEASINNQEIAVVAFLDTEGAFDNIFISMRRIASNCVIKNTICKWITPMLDGGLIKIALAGVTNASIGA